LPRSLVDAHRDTARNLEQQVDKTTEQEVPAADVLLEKQRIRGWPAAGKGISGAIARTDPAQTNTSAASANGCCQGGRFPR
jgi:hypothetical protein